MLRAAFLLSTIALFSTYAMAQSDCPSISVNGPAGIVQVGELANYSVAIDLPPEGQLTLHYVWSVSAGTIVRGQGTTVIEVRQPTNESVTVTVEVRGLPQGCPNSATETAAGLMAPEAIRIGVLRSFEAGKYEEQLAGFIEELLANSNNQGYLFIDHKKTATKSDMARKEKIIIDALPSPFDRSRITFVRWEGGSGIAEFWRVPPAASNPLCEECGKVAGVSAQCPTISVAGPAGITMPGDLMYFRAELTGEIPNNVSYHWKIKDGEIIAGQGTLEIRGKYSTSVWYGNVLATITVSGLPEGCSNTASEKLNMTGPEPEPELLGSIRGGKYVINQDLIEQLGNALRQQPNPQLYVIVYSRLAENKFTGLMWRLLKQLSLTKIDHSRFTIVRSDIKDQEAAFWLIRPGVSNPAP
ncbi:MAG: hypothetical protein ABI481_05370 [Pyrinomonadaceae bacterium]